MTETPCVTNVVKLSERYITDRFLPDKAIDLLDEACACCNLRHPEVTELVETQRSAAELESREHELENPEPEERPGCRPSTTRRWLRLRRNWPSSAKNCPPCS